MPSFNHMTALLVAPAKCPLPFDEKSLVCS
jgi:hypothetical protein